MRGKIWAAIRTLAENEGITFDACLGLMLQVLNLLPQIPVDISFQTQIPVTITYWPGSSHLQKMAPRAGWSFTSLQGSQGILHSLQSPGRGHPPTKRGHGSSPISGCFWQLHGIRWVTGLQTLILQLCPKYHSCPQLAIRLCGFGGRSSLCLLPCHRRQRGVKRQIRTLPQ